MFAPPHLLGQTFVDVAPESEAPSPAYVAGNVSAADDDDDESAAEDTVYERSRANSSASERENCYSLRKPVLRTASVLSDFREAPPTETPIPTVTPREPDNKRKRQWSNLDESDSDSDSDDEE